MFSRMNACAVTILLASAWFVLPACSDDEGDGDRTDVGQDPSSDLTSDVRPDVPQDILPDLSGDPEADWTEDEVADPIDDQAPDEVTDPIDDEAQEEVSDVPVDSAQPPDCGFDPDVQYDHIGEIWQLISDDELTCLRLIREDICPPDTICMAVPYELHLLVVGHHGEVVTIDESAHLFYAPSWHNWEDVAQGTTQDTLYRLDIDYDGTTGYYYRFTLTAFELVTSNTIWGPIELSPIW